MKVYLDHAATTPIRMEVYDKMMENMAKDFANADSIHSLGRESANIVLSCRDNIAKLIGAQSKEIYFTSGGTESDNWAIKGVAFANKEKGKHIITSHHHRLAFGGAGKKSHILLDVVHQVAALADVAF